MVVPKALTLPKRLRLLSMQLIRLFILIVLGCGISATMLAQPVSIKDSAIATWMLSPSYAGYLPSGDMAKRFGYSSLVGMNVGFKWANNYYLNGGAHFLFGGNVKENQILKALQTPEGYIMNNNVIPATPRLLERGIIIPLSVGKIFPLKSSNNPNSGIYVEAGGQFIQHKIWIRSSEGTYDIMKNDRVKGYDRMTNGFGIREGIGYRFFGNHNYGNFAIGLDFSQNFTQNRRSINVDEGKADARQRIDILSGFTASWCFPIYKDPKKTFYYR